MVWIMLVCKDGLEEVPGKCALRIASGTTRDIDFSIMYYLCACSLNVVFNCQRIVLSLRVFRFLFRF